MPDDGVADGVRRAPSNGKGFCRVRVEGPLKLKLFMWA